MPFLTLQQRFPLQMLLRLSRWNGNLNISHQLKQTNIALSTFVAEKHIIFTSDIMYAIPVCWGVYE